ncbi:uncharacterized protein BT62DRAFT_749481 [Guyanagaster necrorhizus]|uniref:Uncharacterized protein n=1 Tax=Guyanagaster necrorhizus TaxID=856835 RepID=A0A9P8AVL3_9AGAR|nr:uncharacterized protein BT62DRAFT_749481 [Guyanagaster necrorhizus MCA 3950]KAG7448027.1 hypothetical protein BT62DRAFT_749481 [Guyanagaster necrorhizus MCA 3950]
MGCWNHHYYCVPKLLRGAFPCSHLTLMQLVDAAVCFFLAGICYRFRQFAV